MDLKGLAESLVAKLTKTRDLPSRDLVEQWGRAVNDQAAYHASNPDGLTDISDESVLPVLRATRSFSSLSASGSGSSAPSEVQISDIVGAISDPEIIKRAFGEIVIKYTQLWELPALTMLEVHRNHLTPVLSSADHDTKDVWMRGGPGGEGMNLLHQTTRRCSKTIVSKLLDNIAISHADSELAQKLIRSKDTANQNVLEIAVYSMRAETVELLLSHDKQLLEDCYEENKRAPLHVLIMQIVERPEALTTDDCSTILDLIVNADPVKALTSSYKGQELFSVRHDSLVPYELALKAREGFEQKAMSGFHSGSKIKPSDRREILDSMLQKMEDLMFRHLDLANIRMAAFKKFDNAEFSLSDFDFMDSDQQVDNFIAFINGLLDAEGTFKLPSKLARLDLPDVSRGGVCNMANAYRELFDILKRFKVEKIFRLYARDNPQDPVDDDKIAEFVMKFQVESLNWSKYNLDIEPLIQKNKDQPLSLRSLTLYSSGNWGCLYHWLSPDGLPSIPKIQDVTIVVDEPRVEAVRTHIEQASRRNQNLGKIHINVVPRKDLAILKDISLRPVALDERLLKACEDAVRKIYVQPQKNTISDIKVAVIDSGVRIDKVPYNIVNGDSGVLNHKGRLAPWYTCKDPHGTQMASLVVTVNPHCELYTYRIKNGLRDPINAAVAEKGIRWALDEKVDIVNLSWSFDKASPTMGDILQRVSHTEPTLVFCAKSDEILSQNVWPADFDEMISVAMAPTEQWSTSVGRPADLLLLGQAIPVENTRVTGSSASTALASGIASLILALAKERGVPNWEQLKRKDRMMSIFRKFKVDKQNTLSFVDPAVLFRDLEALLNVIRLEAYTPSNQ